MCPLSRFQPTSPSDSQFEQLPVFSWMGSPDTLSTSAAYAA